MMSTNQFNQLIPRCDLCLTVSGTSTLHAAGHGAPQIVVYRINPVLWHLAARWLINTRTFSLVNLLNDGQRTIVPVTGDPAVAPDSENDTLAIVPTNPSDPEVNVAVSGLPTV